ncbi:MAG: hypothetical protein Q7S57_06155 [bacterium]|nr:hypothetical protein [bacterium]
MDNEDKERELLRLWTQTIQPLLVETTGAQFPEHNELVKISEVIDREASLELFFDRMSETVVDGFRIRVIGDRSPRLFGSFIARVTDGVQTVGTIGASFFGEKIRVDLTPL